MPPSWRAAGAYSALIQEKAPDFSPAGFPTISLKPGPNPQGRPLYPHMQATSPVDPRVLDAMLPYFIDQYGNPHSRTHVYGWESEEGVEKAREHIAKLVGANAKEIIFTSGATEANNIAVKGVMHFYKEKKKHIITATADVLSEMSFYAVMEKRATGLETKMSSEVFR